MLFIIKQLSAAYGGEGGIRTHDTLARIPVFETGPFNRSGTSPEAHILTDKLVVRGR